MGKERAGQSEGDSAVSNFNPGMADNPKRSNGLKGSCGCGMMATLMPWGTVVSVKWCE